MPFTSWGRRSKWLSFLSFLFLLLGITTLFVVPALQTDNSHHLVSRAQPYAWDETQDLAFRIDADTWALQNRNYTPPNWIGRRQTVGTDTQQTYTCGVGKPCSNGACCGESGICGYGSTYCGTGCTSNCDAKAPCGQYSESGDATCPLNVCCSEWGFCGTTSDFCGTGCQSNCRTPASPGSGGDVRNTVIGYWESWRARESATAPCYTMPPSEIPIQGLTGLNYAFAYIKPNTYDIVPMSGYSYDLFAQVTNVKKANPDAKVFVSVGGWTFSDNKTSTQPVFGDIASTLSKRAQFAAKLYQFMVQYGFDGVDLDWEYPGAPDRGGNPQDAGNYPLLLQMIKYKFQVENKNWGVSITAPTSYWYLRWFDLNDIVKYVDYINLMSYDLHGVWDSTDPIGPYVYAHTNLTEIDAALSLLWRNNVSPSQVNLGLAFYGRSFQLKDPSCIDPGCQFSGPGVEGVCTITPGILSYAEIQDIIAQYAGQSLVTYDPEAGVNYMVYGENNWVSFDDKTTFQQKIDFANERGLNGLFIWAVDMDDSSFTALKAVTGKDIIATVGQSETLGNWNINECFTTPCGTDCAEGFLTMTSMQQDSNGKGCPNGLKRNFCCPPWGAPDPGTCKWNGNPKSCFGQCAPGEVLLTTDKCGDNSGCCNTGEKAFCCPATSGAAAVAACKAEFGSSCPSNLPQKLGTIGLKTQNQLCCPAEPTFSNCSWYGDSFTCAGNRCPAGQIEIARSSHGDGSYFASCIFGRQKAFCCDPPFNGTAFLPVPLDYLFPESLPAADPPVYYEAFDDGSQDNEVPSFDSSYTNDPNMEPFAWTIMVGGESDVQSLRKRDGSHLETFDCPNPHPSDYSVQTFKAVCTVEGDENNCEDITIGSVRGTIIRLPEECGPDEWVRVVSFRRIEDHPLPSHLSKRLHENPKVYEIKYDYNLRQLRRDGDEVYVRFDASVHPGYWDEIVSSSPTGPVKRRSPEEWREFHMDWFEHRLDKRGYGSSDSWWLDRFNALLNRNSSYGLQKTYHFQQNLYHAAKYCPPVMATVDAEVQGDLSVRLDYGISLIGTLRNFDFSESYAFFNLHNLGIDSRATLTANALFKFESQPLSLLDKWDPFGGSFNIKGLWTVGPYFDATAQIQALATISGQVSAGMIVETKDRFTYMFPQSLNQFPSGSTIQPYLNSYSVETGSSATISSDGSVTLTVTPSVGFQIQLDAWGQSYVNTKVVSSFSNALTLRVGASTGSLCNGANYGLDYSLGVTISLENPLPGWRSGPQTINVYGTDAEISPMRCYSWQSSSSKRDLDSGIASPSGSLIARDQTSTSTLFPDIFASALGCPNNKTTPTGNCKASIIDDSDIIMDKRSYLLDEFDPEDEFGEEDGLHEFDKRDKKRMSFCGGRARITGNSLAWPPSGKFIDDEATYPFVTYGAVNPDDCDDYTYGIVPTPPADQSSQWEVEHVLEWQLLKKFFVAQTENNPQTFVDPSGKSQKPIDICKYLQFWWSKKPMTFNGVLRMPIDYVGTAYPSTNQFRNELMLIDGQTNNIKKAVWDDNKIRRDDWMWNALNANGKHDFNEAINVCKYLIFALDYVTIPAVSQVLVTQATRVGQYLDDAENVIASYNLPGWNIMPYAKLGLGDKWKDFMYRQWEVTVTKQREFLDIWVPRIESWSNDNADADGDVQMGGVEDNQDVLTRVEALKKAWQNLPSSLTNPFPASWKT